MRNLVNRVNACAVALQDSPRVGRFVRRRMTVVTYTGRRSGKTFSTPVAYRRTPGGVTIDVALPDRKKWWRNFLDGGHPLTLVLDDVEQHGHATARRENGRVRVEVLLDTDA